MDAREREGERTVMAHMVSVEMDSVRVRRMGETPARNRTKRTAGLTQSVSRPGGSGITLNAAYTITIMNPTVMN